MASRKASTRRTTPTGAGRAKAASGRVTPKGTNPAGKRAAGPKQEGAPADAAPGRYTPPLPKAQQASPMWVPVLMFALLGIGTLVIITNYLGFLPGETDNRYLLLGLAFITGGFITATQYR